MMNEFKINIEVKGLKELTEAVRALAGIPGGQQAPVSAPMPETFQAACTAPVQAPVSPAVPQSYGQQPMPPASVPAGMNMQQPEAPAAGMSVPTTAAVQEYTIEQLQVAAAGLAGMGKMPQVMGILQRFGIQAMTELPKERYGEFATALREAGAQI